jgi:hypothetical protein
LSVSQPEKGNFMSYRAVISIAAAAMLGIACVSTDAVARGGRGGFHTGGHGAGFRGAGFHGGAHAGGVYGRGYHGGYAGRNVNVGVGVGAGAAAVGAAALAPRYYNRVGCGVYPNPPC